eukprot:COSAG01_NODE_2634_length_7332_cov_6393.872390_1_plen_2226_part_10
MALTVTLGEGHDACMAWYYTGRTMEEPQLALLYRHAISCHDETCMVRYYVSGDSKGAEPALTGGYRFTPARYVHQLMFSRASLQAIKKDKQQQARHRRRQEEQDRQQEHDRDRARQEKDNGRARVFCMTQYYTSNWTESCANEPLLWLDYAHSHSQRCALQAVAALAPVFPSVLREWQYTTQMVVREVRILQAELPKHDNMTVILEQDNITSPPSSPPTSCNVGADVVKDVPASQRTASSSYSGGFLPSDSLLTAPRGWCMDASFYDPMMGTQWIQMDYGQTTWMTGVVMKGCADRDKWVTSTKLQVSADGTLWTEMVQPAPDLTPTFQANSDRNTAVYLRWDGSHQARYVRILPQTGHSDPSMRCALLVQSPTYSIPGGGAFTGLWTYIDDANTCATALQNNSTFLLEVAKALLEAEDDVVDLELKALFDCFDRDGDSKLTMLEYMRYLRWIGVWGSRTEYCEENFARHWPTECANMGSDPKHGVTWAGFQTAHGLRGEWDEGRLGERGDAHQSFMCTETFVRLCRVQSKHERVVAKFVAAWYEDAAIALFMEQIAALQLNIEPTNVKLLQTLLRKALESAKLNNRSISPQRAVAQLLQQIKDVSDGACDLMMNTVESMMNTIESTSYSSSWDRKHGTDLLSKMQQCCLVVHRLLQDTGFVVHRLLQDPVGTCKRLRKRGACNHFKEATDSLSLLIKSRSEQSTWDNFKQLCAQTSERYVQLVRDMVRDTWQQERQRAYLHHRYMFEVGLLLYLDMMHYDPHSNRDFLTREFEYDLELEVSQPSLPRLPEAACAVVSKHNQSTIGFIHSGLVQFYTYGTLVQFYSRSTSAVEPRLWMVYGKAYSSILLCEVAPYLLPLLCSPNSDERAHAIRFVAAICQTKQGAQQIVGNRDVRNRILELIDDRHAKTRRSAVGAMKLYCGYNKAECDELVNLAYELSLHVGKVVEAIQTNNNYELQKALKTLQEAASRAAGTTDKEDKKPWGNGKSSKVSIKNVLSAKSPDVCKWMEEQGGIVNLFTGLFNWVKLPGEDQAGVDGATLLTLVQQDDESGTILRDQLHTLIADDRHRNTMSKAVSKFAGFLNRYMLVQRNVVHHSATCVLIYAEDRLQDLQEVALKCMINKQQFEKEVLKRQGLAPPYAMSALRAHVPKFMEVTDAEFMKTIDEGDIKVIRNAELNCENGAKEFDDRLVGQFVIAMERAECDLGSHILHGHYAGRKKQRVEQVARQVAECLHYLEKKGLAHADVKPMNFVLVKIANEKAGRVMLIDFDSTAKHGELCYLKYSSAFAAPALAERLHQYQTQKLLSKTSLEWEEWLQDDPDRALTATVYTDIWSFGIFLYRLCVEDSAPLFISTEADNIVKQEDLATLAYHWEQYKLTELERIKWPEARDLALWCLQRDERRRPSSFEHILEHQFFGGAGKLHCLQSSISDSWKTCMETQTIALHNAIEQNNHNELVRLFEAGGVHITMIAPSSGGLIRPLHRAVYAMCASKSNILDTEILKFLLSEIPACAPLSEKRIILDGRIRFDYTAYMVACEQGKLDAVELLVDAGCSTELKNSFGQTGLELAYANHQTVVCDWLKRKAETETHDDLPSEFQRRKLRPDVQSARRDELEVAAERLTFWAVQQAFDSWRRIGGGAYGDIFLVPAYPPLQLGDGQLPVCSLVVKAVVAADNTKALEALRDEIKALCALRHQNIVRVFGFSFTERPISDEDEEDTNSLRRIDSCAAEKDEDVLLGAVRLAKQQSKTFGLSNDPLSLYSTRRADCKAAGRSAKEPTWALLLEQCNFDLTVPIYNKHPWSEGPTLSWARRLDIAQQMASGLAYIHANDQVHWDLKPGNILLKKGQGSEWVVKVADFGMGEKSTEDVADAHAEPVGTPEYMAPEAWHGRPTPASDVFSFGIILWELYTQQRVYTGFPHFDLQHHTVDEHISMWMATKDARPDIPPGCPEPWALLMQACWAAEPPMRPTFDDIAAALRAMIPLVKDWAATHTVAAESTETTTAPTVQQWMETLGLGTKVKAFVSTSCLQEGTKYLEGVKTIEDEEFRELLEDVDDLEEAIDEMVGEEEDELTEEEATKLKAALRALLEPTSPPEQAPATAPTVQQWMKSLSLGAKVEAFINMSGLQEGKKYLEGVKTIEDEEFRELLEDMEELDEAVDEMIGEEDGLTEEEAARLTAALRALRCVDEGAPDETAGSHADVRPWTALCTVLGVHLRDDGHAAGTKLLSC